GNVWKTTNAGTTWAPVFDGESAYSVGCITLDPNRADTVWLGTGENVGGRHVGYGDGVYRSLDGGKSWENMGLEGSEHIGMIRVDPRDSNVVYVAAQGPLWSAGGDRGLFKSDDGGKSWNKILGGGEYTGVNEVHLDPRNPDVIYASTHQRLRTVAALMNGGPESGIHKSTDGGKTWRELKSGLPEENMGKIGLAISPQKPDVVYATIELERRSGGFWRSEDGGESWEKRNDYVSGATGPHYYQEIFASPHHFDTVYQADVWMRVTRDGGKTFNRVDHDHMHPDHHAVVFDPDDEDYILVGSDGGIYETWDHGATWKYIANLPVTQFYKLAVDYDTPFYNLYGGTQDNNTQGGPSRTDNTHGIRNSDWFITLFGDGHQPAVDPTNPDIIYSEWQQGNLVRYDRKSGEIVYIQPQPEPGEPFDRFNWDAPIYISAHDPKRLYFASQRLWRSDDRGDSWRALSGDLSRGLDRLKMPMMGRVWSWDSPWDTYAMSRFGTITSIAESPIDENLLYVGTDDGLIQVSEDGGATWRKVSRMPSVPEFYFVNDIKADLHDEDTVYVVADNHKVGDFKPYILKSTNRGKSWRSIKGDLPDRHLLWRLVQDHVNSNLLFVGTEFGVFFTIDGGQRWVKLEGGAPNIPFRDLAIQKRENDLVGATFGRGFYILDDYTPLREISESDLQKEAVLFPVKDALWYLPKNTLGRERGDGNRATQGASFFIAPNPPFGAVFTYYLRDELKSKKETRREAEKKAEKKGDDTPYPGWDALRAEEFEGDPAIIFTVRDEGGNVIRHFDAPAKAGFQRAAWDLRYPAKLPWAEDLEDED
ncbi:MAG: glycosyl hydrolase, partial [Gammaproteobacteria bacterium]|nr:glycosyl hydrolase [Gammaproteobacteria bacterium]